METSQSSLSRRWLHPEQFMDSPRQVSLQSAEHRDCLDLIPFLFPSIKAQLRKDKELG